MVRQGMEFWAGFLHVLQLKANLIPCAFYRWEMSKKNMSQNI
jgi:hypothetical protein